MARKLAEAEALAPSKPASAKARPKVTTTTKPAAKPALKAAAKPATKAVEPAVKKPRAPRKPPAS